MQIETIRFWQLTQLELGIKSVEWIVRSAEQRALSEYRDSGEGWTVVEVIGHLRDFEQVYVQRAKLIVEQENPPLPFPDPDELVRSGRYNELSWRDLFDEWKQARATYLDYLRARVETDWERTAQHPTRGLFTLHDQLFLSTLHDSIHIEQISRILLEKRMHG
jgi:hypothetical protein